MPKKLSAPDLKKKLIEAAIAIQQKKVDASREAMLQAQETANEQGNSMADKHENFREMMQIDRDMYAKQMQEGLNVLAVLNRIDPEKKNTIPALGAVVVTNSKKFFVSASLGQLSVDGETYIAISSQSPMFLAMTGKKKGGEFVFGNGRFKVEEVL
jgi:hypothetical protein